MKCIPTDGPHVDGVAFPNQIKTYRRKPDLEVLLCAVLAAHGLLRLKNHGSERAGKSILRILPHGESSGALMGLSADPAERDETIRGLVDRQRPLYLGPRGHDTSCVYQWFNPFRYVGFAHLARTTRPDQSRITVRWMEHLLHTVRSHTAEAAKKRYRLAKKWPLEKCCYLVCQVGPTTRMRAAESFEIAAYRPVSNIDRIGRVRGRPRGRRRRPPRHRRRPIGRQDPEKHGRSSGLF